METDNREYADDWRADSAAGPLPIHIPECGFLVAESRHGPGFAMTFQEHSFHEVFLLLRGRLQATTRRQTVLEPPKPLAPGLAVPGLAVAVRSSSWNGLVTADGGVADGRIGSSGMVGDREPTEMIWQLECGDYLIVPAGVPHLLHDDRSSTLVVVAMAVDALVACAGRLDLWNMISSPGSAIQVRGVGDRERYGTWRHIIALQNRPQTPEVRLGLESALNEFLVQIASQLTLPHPKDASERVAAFAAALATCVHEAWTLDRAASINALSRRRFSELFRRVTGDSFIPYLQQRRIEAAQTLIAGGRYSIAGAAYAVGFEDLAHFYRIFRKYAACSPGAWLRTARQTART